MRLGLPACSRRWAGGQFPAFGITHALADAGLQGLQVVALQLVGKARIASQHDAEAGVELRGGKQAQFAEHCWLQRFVDQQDRPDRFKVVLPAPAQHLEAAPSVVGT